MSPVNENASDWDLRGKNTLQSQAPFLTIIYIWQFLMSGNTNHKMFHNCGFGTQWQLHNLNYSPTMYSALSVNAHIQ